MFFSKKKLEVKAQFKIRSHFMKSETTEAEKQ